MNYKQICQNIKGKGIQEYDQGKESILANININNGVCRALVIMWLKAKKGNSNFWKNKGTISEPLLNELQRLQSAVNLQEEYAAACKSRYIPDTATLNELRDVDLEYYLDDVSASVQEGFVQTTPNDEPLKIANHILSSKSRFYILSISGSDGGHSIGIHRPYSLIGKSNSIYLFDPNIGEFQVNTAEDVKTLLIKLNTLGYANINIDLNKQYLLWSYVG